MGLRGGGRKGWKTTTARRRDGRANAPSGEMEIYRRIYCPDRRQRAAEPLPSTVNGVLGLLLGAQEERERERAKYSFNWWLAF